MEVKLLGEKEGWNPHPITSTTYAKYKNSQTCLGICGPKTVKGLQPLYLLEKSSNEFTADAGYYITHCNLDQCSLINKDSKITIASGFIVSIKLS